MIEVIGLATYHIITHNLKFTISNLIDQKVLVLVLSEMMYLKALMVVLPLSLTAKLIHKL